MPPIPPGLMPIKVPAMGLGTESLRVSAWLVSIGDRVLHGDRLVELVGDGFTVDLPAPAAGELVQRTHGMDSMVREGDILAYLLPEAEGTAPP